MFEIEFMKTGGVETVLVIKKNSKPINKMDKEFDKFLEIELPKGFFFRKGLFPSAMLTVGNNAEYPLRKPKNEAKILEIMNKWLKTVVLK